MRRRELADFKIRSKYVIRILQIGKSTVIDKIPSEIIINGSSQLVITMNLLCQKIWDKKEWPDA